MKACVDERGRLQGDPVVQRSSGYEAFDKGAIEAARDGRYARATQGGTARTELLFVPDQLRPEMRPSVFGKYECRVRTRRSIV